MGWSLSFYFAQHVHEARSLGCGIRRQQLICDKLLGVAITSDETRAAIYVDNHSIVGEDHAEVTAQARAIATDLNRVHLDTHEAFHDCECDFVGLAFDRRRGRHIVCLKWDRFRRLRFAIEYVLDRGAASGRDIQIPVGRITLAMLLAVLLVLSSLIYLFTFFGNG